jgi:putative ABC transport system substrate-binding protein
MSPSEQRSRDRSPQLARRGFVVGAASAALLLSPALAEWRARPRVGFLHSASRELTTRNLEVLRTVLDQAGYREGDTVLIHYRWADGRYDRLPALVAELIEQQVDVLVAMGAADGPRAAKRATGSIPIVFGIGSDPVVNGLVSSLNPQRGNVTGVTFLSTPLGPKRLELLRELLPGSKSVAILTNPQNLNISVELDNMRTAAQRLSLNLVQLGATRVEEFDTAFASAAQQRTDAVVVMTDALFNAHIEPLVAAASRHAMPTMYFLKEFVAAGGLVSYGASITAMYRQVGDYIVKILGGARPSDLPVLQPTTFELSINASAAKALGLAIPASLLALADEVLE